MDTEANDGASMSAVPAPLKQQPPPQPQSSTRPDRARRQPSQGAPSVVRGRQLAGRGETVYLSMPEVVERYADVWSKWTIYEWVRRGSIPHVKLPGRRKLLFRLDDLEAYESGEIELETVKLPHGGRLCRPRRR